MATPRLTADFWIINQPYPFVPYNRSLGRLDGLVQATVINETTADPPDPIVDGAQYIIAATATGDWTGQELAIAYGYQKKWLITTPIEGFLVYNQALDKFRYFNGLIWVDLPSGTGSGSVTSITGQKGVTATPNPITTVGTVEVDQAITFWTKEDETAKLAASRKVFAGTGISLDYTVAGRVTINSTDSQAAIQWQDEGSNLGTAGTVDTVDFVGAGVTATRASNKVTVTIPAPGTGIPTNTQTGNYTLVLGDAGYCIYRDGSNGTNTWTIPANGSVAFPYGASGGTVVMFDNRDSAANTTIAITSDTLIYTPGNATGSRVLLPGGRAFAHKVLATTWIISGTGIY